MKNALKELKAKKRTVELELKELKSELIGAENDLDNYLDDSDNFTKLFDDFLDENYSTYTELGHTFYPSDILKSDPTAYRTDLNDWVSGSREYLIDADSEAQELDDIVTELGEKIEELEQEIEELEMKIDELEEKI